MTKLIYIAFLAAVTALGAACSGEGEKSTTTTTNSGTTASAPAANTGGNHSTTSASSNAGADAEVPAVVRSAMPDAQSVTTQHKDLSASQIAEIEKETGTKIKETDHHSYLGFSTAGGTRKQIGAATVVDAAGKKVVIVYESRNGVPYIKEVRAEGMAQAFLDQFKGKGHDEKLQVGQDLKAQGLDEATARAASDAIRQDTRIMQALYGGAHGH